MQKLKLQSNFDYNLLYDNMKFSHFRQFASNLKNQSFSMGDFDQMHTEFDCNNLELAFDIYRKEALLLKYHQK